MYRSVLKQLTGLLFIVDAYPQTRKSYVGIEKMEDEYVLTSAEYLLSLAHLKPTSSGKVLFLLNFLYTRFRINKPWLPILNIIPPFCVILPWMILINHLSCWNMCK